MAKTNRSSNAGVTSDAIPDSRLHGGGGSEECPESLLGLHMNGTPCEDLPPSVWSFLTPDRTDEGLELALSGAGFSRVGRGDLENRMAKRADGLAAGMQPWEAPDVLKEAAAKLPPGMRGKFISEGRAKRGEVASRGYEMFKGEDGDAVRVGDMVLAMMPEEMAERRNAHYRARAQQVSKTSDVALAKGASSFAGQGAEYSENGAGGRTLGESVLDDSPALPGNFDSDTGRYEA